MYVLGKSGRGLINLDSGVVLFIRDRTDGAFTIQYFYSEESCDVIAKYDSKEERDKAWAALLADLNNGPLNPDGGLHYICRLGEYSQERSGAGDGGEA